MWRLKGRLSGHWVAICKCCYCCCLRCCYSCCQVFSHQVPLAIDLCGGAGGREGWWQATICHIVKNTCINKWGHRMATNLRNSRANSDSSSDNNNNNNTLQVPNLSLPHLTPSPCSSYPADSSLRGSTKAIYWILAINTRHPLTHLHSLSPLSSSPALFAHILITIFFGTCTSESVCACVV